MSVRWRRDPEPLALLERSGLGPFATVTYRRVWADAGLGWRDASIGALAADGTRAAIPLLASGRTADSLPYGYAGVVATRRLDDRELHELLVLAARELGVGRITARAIPCLTPGADHGREQGSLTTQVVFLDPATSPADSFTAKALQSIRRATRAGCVVRSGSDPSDSLRLYEGMAARRAVRYPEAVIRGLSDAGVARFYDVVLDSETVSTLIALVSPDHWMYWIAAQSEGGRRAEAGYLGLAALIEDAHASSAGAVNLGASTGLPGVAKFKRRFGAVEVQILQYAYVGAGERLRSSLDRLTGRMGGAGRRLASGVDRRLQPLRSRSRGPGAG
jgi:Acetyltransferase (GNAT) domain